MAAVRYRSATSTKVPKFVDDGGQMLQCKKGPWPWAPEVTNYTGSDLGLWFLPLLTARSTEYLFSMLRSAASTLMGEYMCRQEFYAQSIYLRFRYSIQYIQETRQGSE